MRASSADLLYVTESKRALCRLPAPRTLYNTLFLPMDHKRNCFSRILIKKKKEEPKHGASMPHIKTMTGQALQFSRFYYSNFAPLLFLRCFIFRSHSYLLLGREEGPTRLGQVEEKVVNNAFNTVPDFFPLHVHAHHIIDDILIKTCLLVMT